MTLSRSTALHEAAHAIAAHRLGYEVHDAAVYPSGGGATHYLRREGDEEHFMLIAAAGRAAELEGGFPERRGALDDLDQVAETLPSWRDPGDGVGRAIDRAQALVGSYWDSIERLADALMARNGYLDGPALASAIDHALDDTPIDPAGHAHDLEQRRIFETVMLEAGPDVSPALRSELWRYAGRKAAGWDDLKPALPRRRAVPSAEPEPAPADSKPATPVAATRSRSRGRTVSLTDWYISTVLWKDDPEAVVRLIQANPAALTRFEQQQGVTR